MSWASSTKAPRSREAIFNVFNGAMTTAGARWLAVGNPTRNEGYFYDVTHGNLVARKNGDLQKGMWNAFIVPSWDSPFVDPSWVDDMKRQYGEDSDEYRVRVCGLPPRFDSEQFFQPELITKAKERTIPMFQRWPLILGADVGRGDRSVLCPRRGRVVLDGIRIFNGMRTMDFARIIAEDIKFWREDAGLTAQVVIEELGMGVGVVETLQDMGFAEQTWGVNTGESARQPELYLNLRCEMYGEAKRWLEELVELPNSPELSEDLMKIKRKPSANGKLRLETKDEMRRRGVKSPDVGDAFALTFAIDFDLLPEKKDGWGQAWAQSSAAPAGSWMSN
jgi:phage terminase large subunit